jgi:mRNA interferase MazF
MRRGDVVTVAGPGDYGKPRPAVIVQTNALPESHTSVVVCQMTLDLPDAPDFRVTIEPGARSGLRVRSQVINPFSIRRRPRISESAEVARFGTAAERLDASGPDHDALLPQAIKQESHQTQSFTEYATEFHREEVNGAARKAF